MYYKNNLSVMTGHKYTKWTSNWEMKLKVELLDKAAVIRQVKAEIFGYVVGT